MRSSGESDKVSKYARVKERYKKKQTLYDWRELIWRNSLFLAGSTGFSLVNVMITVQDMNDNAPVFIYPVYPETDEDVDISNTLFGIVSNGADPFTRVMAIKVKDVNINVYFIYSM